MWLTSAWLRTLHLMTLSSSFLRKTKLHIDHHHGCGSLCWVLLSWPCHCPPLLHCCTRKSSAPVVGHIEYQWGHLRLKLHCHVCSHQGSHVIILWICAHLEYAILDLRLLSILAVLHLAFLRCSFAAVEALRLRSVVVRLITSAAASLKTFDGSVFTAFFHDIGPHPAPSLQGSPAPTQWPCHDPPWVLLICLPPSNFTSYTVQLDLLDRKSRVVMRAHAMHVISLAFSSASAYKFTCTKNTRG